MDIHSKTGTERLTSDTPDISDRENFEFYDLVWYSHRGDEKSIPKIKRFSGLAHACDSTLNSSTLPDIWKVIMRTTVQHPTATELKKTYVQQLVRD